jgi:hypothetical protein
MIIFQYSILSMLNRDYRFWTYSDLFVSAEVDINVIHQLMHYISILLHTDQWIVCCKQFSKVYFHLVKTIGSHKTLCSIYYLNSQLEMCYSVNWYVLTKKYA